ncbi:MAG: hypothetical protein ACRDOM_06760 [Nocardioides sp.]
MNTNHRRPAWGIALAAFVLTLTAACGTDASDGTTRIRPGTSSETPADPKPGSGEQLCQGSPQQGGFVCETPAPAPGSGSADDRRPNVYTGP